jgi:hypothetical protein
MCAAAALPQRPSLVPCFWFLISRLLVSVLIILHWRNLTELLCIMCIIRVVHNFHACKKTLMLFKYSKWSLLLLSSPEITFWSY